MNNERKVIAPAIALMVTGILNGIYFVISMLANLFMGAAVLIPKEYQDGAGTLLTGAFGVIFALLWILISIFVVFGAMKMKNLENHTLALIASIIAMIPCFMPCCLLWAIPFGIWALVVLLNPDVKACFK